MNELELSELEENNQVKWWFLKWKIFKVFVVDEDVRRKECEVVLEEKQ